MNFRKVTSGCMFAFIAAIMVGSMMIGCSNDELIEVGSKRTLATRGKINPIELDLYYVNEGGFLHEKIGYYTKLNSSLHWNGGYVFRNLSVNLHEQIRVDSIRPFPGEIKRIPQCSFENKQWLYPEDNDTRVRISYSSQAITKILFKNEKNKIDTFFDYIFLDTIVYVDAIMKDTLRY